MVNTRVDGATLPLYDQTVAWAQTDLLIHVRTGLLVLVCHMISSVIFEKKTRGMVLYRKNIVFTPVNIWNYPSTL